MEKKKIYVLACGGTIAGKAASADDLTGYAAGQTSVGELLAAVPELAEYADVEGEQFCNIDSSDMTEALWLSLASRVQEIADREDVDGIVITHGTDTMEETAYFLDLTVHTIKPVVLTGSMRPSTAISADGPLNLLEAVQAASWSELGKYGVVIVMNSTVHSARFVEKTDTTHADTFKGRQMGCLGYMQDGRPYLYQQPLRKHTWSSDLASPKDLPPVALRPMTCAVWPRGKPVWSWPASVTVKCRNRSGRPCSPSWHKGSSSSALPAPWEGWSRRSRLMTGRLRLIP